MPVQSAIIHRVLQKATDLQNIKQKLVKIIKKKNQTDKKKSPVQRALPIRPTKSTDLPNIKHKLVEIIEKNQNKYSNKKSPVLSLFRNVVPKKEKFN